MASACKNGVLTSFGTPRVHPLAIAQAGRRGVVEHRAKRPAQKENVPLTPGLCSDNLSSVFEFEATRREKKVT